MVAHVDDGSGNGGVSPSGGVYGFQNAALVTADADGSIGITVAGYFVPNGANYVQGIVQHFEVAGSISANADQARRVAAVPPRRGADRVRRRRRPPSRRATAPRRRRTGT